MVLILAIGALLVWAAMSGQFESLEDEGRRILDDDEGRPPKADAAEGSPPKAG